MPTIIVHLYGHYQDFYPGGLVAVEVPPLATVREAAEALAAADPRFLGVASACRFAVNDAYASLDAAIPHDATVALIPPVSGG